MQLSPKQKQFWNNANSRWNVKSGATRSGKTYMDYYIIPKRIRSVTGKDGLTVILGNTKWTLQRNIIEPLQDIWGMGLVSDIRSDNTAMLFGEKCYCLGADKVNQVNRIRGSSIKYCYGDEVVTWHEDVFNMLKSVLISRIVSLTVHATRKDLITGFISSCRVMQIYTCSNIQ